MEEVVQKKKLPIWLLMTLTAVISLGIGIYLGKNVKSVKSEDSNNKKITRTPTPTPVYIINSKKIINGVTYGIERGVNNRDTFNIGEIRQYDDHERVSPLVNTYYTPWSGNWVGDFWYDEELKLLFTIENDTISEPKDAIVQYEISSQEITRKKLFSTVSTERTIKIINYYPQTQTLLLDTESGDGCSFEHEIWSLRNTVKKSFYKFAGGCWGYDQPRYVGFWDGKIIAADHTFNTSVTDATERDSTLNEIYFLDPITLKKDKLFDSTDLQSNTYEARIDASEPELIELSIPHSIYYYNLKTKEFTFPNK